jgi:hypothetical protein
MAGDGRDLRIRPLGIGEALDRAVALHRRHFRELFLAALALELPLFVAARLQASALGELAAGADPARWAAAAHLLPPLAGLALLMLVGQFLLTSAATFLVAPSAAGPEVAPRPPAGRVARAALGAALAGAAATLHAPALGALPGALLALRSGSPAGQVLGAIAAVAGGGLALLWALLAFLLAPAAAAVEGVGGLRSLWRSLRLMRPAPGTPLAERPSLRASLVLLAALAITMAANTLAGLPRAAALLVAGAGSPGARLPLLAEVVVGGIEIAAISALRPFGLVALAVLYFDRRARREGLDLEGWARSLAGAGEVP